MTITWNGDQYEHRIREAAQRGVVRGIGIVDARAVDLILNTSKSGRTYRRRGVTHRASAPGEPFASDTGTTLNRRRIEEHPERLAASLIFSTKTAEWMEHGTRKMEPRPFARRALMESAAEVRAAVINEVMFAIR